MDIDTGLMICNASHKNIFLGEVNVPGKPSERQLTNYWIRAPPLGGGDHLTPERLAAFIRWSLGAEVRSNLACRRFPDNTCPTSSALELRSEVPWPDDTALDPLSVQATVVCPAESVVFGLVSWLTWGFTSGRATAAGFMCCP